MDLLDLADGAGGAHFTDIADVVRTFEQCCDFSSCHRFEASDAVYLESPLGSVFHPDAVVGSVTITCFAGEVVLVTTQKRDCFCGSATAAG